jgi:hypothetical protein
MDTSLWGLTKTWMDTVVAEVNAPTKDAAAASEARAKAGLALSISSGNVGQVRTLLQFIIDSLPLRNLSEEARLGKEASGQAGEPDKVLIPVREIPLELVSDKLAKEQAEKARIAKEALPRDQVTGGEVIPGSDRVVTTTVTRDTPTNARTVSSSAAPSSSVPTPPVINKAESAQVPGQIAGEKVMEARQGTAASAVAGDGK